jgi:exodeoxyribonuclease-3
VGGAKDGRLKIATFNVNGITDRLPNLLRWFAETRPDVACLEELKVPHDKFPEAAIREADAQKPSFTRARTAGGARF